MPTANLPADDSLPPDDLARVIAACDRFEADWNAGRPRRIEDELAAADKPVPSRLFRELLVLELELVRRDGRLADLDAYLARFPERANTVREVFAGDTVVLPDREVTGSVTSNEPASPSSTEGYELIRKLGGGGQATTYLARDRALQRLVVLKRYHGVACSSRREAVLNEGRALARVRSPFVAPCYGVETRGDEIDLVVEYVPGRPLTELTASERADTRHCVRLIEQVAGGLAEVHACGLLHRDIKPQNIILGDDGVPRLVDFGLAVPVASEGLHAVAGSPPYMAPEQARGQGERVDARTDVYGLGAVLYYLLTGQPPHEGKTLIEALEQARDAPIIPPRRLNPRVPRTLERVCVKALAADPQSRFQSADALRRALGRYMLLRRATPVLGVFAILLALVVPVWAFWPRPSPDVLKSEPKQSPQSDLRVIHFEIPHFPKLDAQHFDPRRVGTLGRTSFAAREDDEVTVRAELSEPAYSYLIAFRPDGTDELCDPDDENRPPSCKQQPLYPPPAKSDERYRMSEGAGLHAFALVVSRQPLPPYHEWKRRIGPAPWSARLPCEPGVVWRDDHEGLQPFLAGDSTGTRGKGVKARGSGGPAAKLAGWLRGLPGVDAVALEAFPVEPASGP
jgi:serine/threonine protein kinase